MLEVKWDVIKVGDIAIFSHLVLNNTGHLNS